MHEYSCVGWRVYSSLRMKNRVESVLRMRRCVIAMVLSVSLCGAAPAQSVASPTGIDYSYAGYGAGETALPNIPAVISVRPSGGDDTALLQTAINHVAGMPIGADGFRGTVVLRPGRFRVSGQLRISVSGVVLRGSGVGQTTIVAEGIGRRTLIQVGAASDPEAGDDVQVSADAAAGA